MKDKILRHLHGLNGILLILYTTFIFSTYVFLQKSILPEDFLLKKESFLRFCYMARHVLVVLVLAIIFCPRLLRLFEKIHVVSQSCDEKDKKKYQRIFFAIPFVIFLVLYIGYYPGGLGTDFFDQYQQALTNEYTDWHPVMQTLFAIKLPLLLTGGWIGSIVLMQILLFSAIIAYAIYHIMIYHGKKVAFVSLAFLMLNPTIFNFAVMSLKDTTFAMFILLLVTLLYKTYMTKGEWLKKNSHWIIVMILIAFLTLLRHNAILLTVPMMFVVLLYLPIHKKVITILGVFGIVLLVKYPLYSALQVAKPDQRGSETLGLPLTVIGAVVKYDPESLDEETREFAYKLASEEVWQEQYSYSGYNYVKFDERTNLNVIDEYGAGTIVKMMFRCLVRSPRHAFTALFRVTDGVYGFMDDHAFLLFPDMNENEMGIVQHKNPIISKLNFLYTSAITVMLPFVFSYVGMAHYLLIVLILSKCKLNVWEDWKKIFIVLPVFILNYGTMLLLTYSFDIHRFFWYTFLLMPIFTCLFLGENASEIKSSRSLKT